MAGIKMVHVPYRGLGPAVADLLAGQIQVLFADVPLVVEHAKAGNLKALAITGTLCSTPMPTRRWTARGGRTGYGAGTWYGIFLPARTSPEIVTLSKQRPAAGARRAVRQGGHGEAGGRSGVGYAAGIHDLH